MGKAISILMIMWLALFSLGTWSQAADPNRTFLEGWYNYETAKVDRSMHEVAEDLALGVVTGAISVYNTLANRYYVGVLDQAGEAPWCSMSKGQRIDVVESSVDYLERKPSIEVGWMDIVSTLAMAECQKQTGFDLFNHMMKPVSKLY